jgi:hypothetical protein
VVAVQLREDGLEGFVEERGVDLLGAEGGVGGGGLGPVSCR